MVVRKCPLSKTEKMRRHRPSPPVQLDGRSKLVPKKWARKQMSGSKHPFLALSLRPCVQQSHRPLTPGSPQRSRTRFTNAPVDATRRGSAANLAELEFRGGGDHLKQLAAAAGK